MFINRYICVQDYKSLCVAVVRFVPSSLTSRQTQHTHAHTRDRTVTRYITSSAKSLFMSHRQLPFIIGMLQTSAIHETLCDYITVYIVLRAARHWPDIYVVSVLWAVPSSISQIFHSTFTPKADGTRGPAESSRRYSRVASIDPASVPTNPPLSCYWHASSRRTDRPARPASFVLYSRPIARILVRNMHHCIGGCIHGAARQSASVWYSPVMTEKI